MGGACGTVDFFTLNIYVHRFLFFVYLLGFQRFDRIMRLINLNDLFVRRRGNMNFHSNHGSRTSELS